MSNIVFAPSPVSYANILTQAIQVTTTEGEKPCDMVCVKLWNTNHLEGPKGLLRQIWYSSENSDTYAIRSDGSKTNYVQGDYPITALKLFYWDKDKGPVPKNADELEQNAELVAAIDKADKHVDISGKKWNVSVFYLYRNRNSGGSL